MTDRLRLALLFTDGNFIGPEYFAVLSRAGWRPDMVVAVGAMSEHSRTIERARTGGLWRPPPIPEDAVAGRFASLDDPEFRAFLTAARIDVAIQGGIGILRPETIAIPRLGILNAHPGRLPGYRGRNCPEWALDNGEPIWITAHWIDSGIDTGPVVCESRYEFPATWTYERIRASLYAHCAQTLATALDQIAGALREGRPVPAVAQPQIGARAWPKMDDERLAALRARLERGAAR
ncbi:MAG: hypothetical protein J0H39_01760 [Alphaproteobacteria bacterium]|nr:hypothetical protein [Alphaproteobacteria bacterium]